MSSPATPARSAGAAPSSAPSPPSSASPRSRRSPARKAAPLPLPLPADEEEEDASWMTESAPASSRVAATSAAAAAPVSARAAAAAAVPVADEEEDASFLAHTPASTPSKGWGQSRGRFPTPGMSAFREEEGGLADEPQGPSFVDEAHEGPPEWYGGQSADMDAEEAMRQEADEAAFREAEYADALPPLERAPTRIPAAAAAASSSSARAAPRSYLSEFDDPTDDPGVAAAVAGSSIVTQHWDPAARVERSSPTYARAVAMLKKHWGYDSFRPGQYEVVDAILQHRRDVFCLMATGAGKSLGFQLLPLISGKPCIVISPLISLMTDQVAALRARGITACALNSHVSDPQVAIDAFAGKYQLIYISPERLGSTLPQLKALNNSVGISCFAVDESHCLSEWGHDFRSEYRQLGRIRAHFPRVPILALTATATPAVSADIKQQLRLVHPFEVRTTFNRPNLFFEVKMAQGIKKDFTRAVVGDDKVSCIIYVHTRADTENIAAHLQSIGINAHAYHASLTPKTRQKVHEGFIRDQIRVVVATVAFGMGIDHAETRKVINYGMSKNLESLVQMTGRAGRDGQPAECTLFFAPKDLAMLQFWKGGKGAGWGAGASGGGGTQASQGGSGTGDGSRGLAISKMFDQMKNFVSSTRCRRVLILEYFNEDWRANAPTPAQAVKGVVDTKGNCRHCDNCCAAMARAEAVASAAASGAGATAMQAQMQPSARDLDPSHLYYFALGVHETGEKNGLAFIVQFLRGSKAAKVVDRSDWFRVKPLSACQSYGKLSSESPKYVGALGRYLLQVGVLEQVYRGEFQIVTLAPGGRKLLERGVKEAANFEVEGGNDAPLPPELRQEVEEKRKKAAKRVAGRSTRDAAMAHAESMAASYAAAGVGTFDAHAALRASTSSDEVALLDALIDLRARVSKRRAVAPYTIFSRGELEAFAKYRPISVEALAHFSGVTQTKMSMYGAELVDAIKKFAAQREMQCDLPVPRAIAPAPIAPTTVTEVESYRDFLSSKRGAPAAAASASTASVVTVSAEIASSSCSWHPYPSGPLTRVSVSRSAHRFEADPQLQRFEVWSQLHSSHSMTLEALAASMAVQVSSVLSHLSQVILEGWGYSWERFNIPDVAVQQVQAAVVAAEQQERDRAHPTPDFFEGDPHGIGLWSTPFLRFVRSAWPAESLAFDFGLVRLVLSHLRRVYGPAGPRRVECVQDAPAASAYGVKREGETPSAPAPLLGVDFDRFKRGSPVKAAPIGRPFSLPMRATQPAPPTAPLVLPRRSLSDVLSQDSSLSQPAPTAAAPAASAASFISRGSAPVRHPSLTAAVSSHLRPLYSLPTDALDASRVMTRQKLRVLELYQSGRTIAQISAQLTVRTTTCVQFIADALINGYEIDWAPLRIEEEDRATVMRLLYESQPSLLPPLALALRLPMAAFIPTICAIKKLVREECSKEHVLLLISLFLQQQTLADMEAKAAAAPTDTSAATESAEADEERKADIDSAVFMDSSLPPLERPQPLELQSHAASAAAAAASIVAAAPSVAAPALPTFSPLKRRASSFLPATGALTPEKRARLGVDLFDDESALLEDEEGAAGSGAAVPGAAVSAAAASSVAVDSDFSPPSVPRRGSTIPGAKHISSHPIHMLAQQPPAPCKQAAQVTPTPTPATPSPLMPLSAASILQLLGVSPLRLEQLCERLIPQGADMWKRLGKVQEMLQELQEDGAIFKRQQGEFVLL